MTTAQKVFELLSPIPEEDFIIHYMTNWIDKCCARGHILRITSRNPNNYSPTNLSDGDFNLDQDILEKSSAFLRAKKRSSPFTIAHINNKVTPLYPQETPKQRVIALLTDMIEAGY